MPAANECERDTNEKRKTRMRELLLRVPTVGLTSGRVHANRGETTGVTRRSSMSVFSRHNENYLSTKGST